MFSWYGNCKATNIGCLGSRKPFLEEILTPLLPVQHHLMQTGNNNCQKHQPQKIRRGSISLSNRWKRTKVVIRQREKQEDPPVNVLLVLKKIKGGIRKCASCSKGITNAVIGYNYAFGSQCCLARHEVQCHVNISLCVVFNVVIVLGRCDRVTHLFSQFLVVDGRGLVGSLHRYNSFT